MRHTSVGRIVGLIGVCVVLCVGAAAAEEPIDSSLPEVSGIPVAEPAPWTGLEGGGELPGLVDDFNRPDGDLGPNWSVPLPSMYILGEAATGTPNNLAIHNSATGDSVEADVAIDPSTILQYAALTLNYGGGSSNIFVKVQNQENGPVFDRLYCYEGTNSGIWFGIGTTPLTEPFATAHMRVSVDGNRDVTIDLTNIDGGTLADQQYICTDAPPAEGPGVGMAVCCFDDLVRIDNFGSEVVPVDLMSLSVE